MRHTTITLVLFTCVALAHAGVRADLSGDAVVDFQTTMDMPFMAVGNAGNAADYTGFGAVDYEYNIGKFEVTAGQYTEFLNAVAGTDTYDLYHPYMAESQDDYRGCNIERSGYSGSYTYSVTADSRDRPVNYVSWGDAARFCNWLTNGMPSGDQVLTTTEDGSYFLNGASSGAALQAVTREANARYIIPTEDEWYKAAYHKNDGVTSNYFDYSTSSDTLPSYVADDGFINNPDPGNVATYDGDGGINGIGEPYWRTEAGEHENTCSPYEAFDMTGNVWEWNEAAISGQYRGLRGGSFFTDDGLNASFGSLLSNPVVGSNVWGFRVAEVPEPATMSLLALGGVALLRRKK